MVLLNAALSQHPRPRKVLFAAVAVFFALAALHAGGFHHHDAHDESGARCHLALCGCHAAWNTPASLLVEAPALQFGAIPVSCLIPTRTFHFSATPCRAPPILPA